MKETEIVKPPSPLGERVEFLFSQVVDAGPIGLWLDGEEGKVAGAVPACERCIAPTWAVYLSFAGDVVDSPVEGYE